MRFSPKALRYSCANRTLLAAASLLALVAAGDAAMAQNRSKQTQAAQTQGPKVADLSLAPMLQRVIPGVVSVRVTGARERPVVIGASGGPGAANQVQTQPKEPFRSGGSGVIVDAAKGIIITNHHVIVDAVQIEVGLVDGRAAPAKLIGTDVGTDVAVLQIDLPKLTSVPFGDSDTIRVGDVILAVGNPFGLEHSASKGIVSALARSDIGYEIFEDFIQVDAAINPGNSGGALVDVEGRLVGINTATASGKSRAQGISFAIPVNMARAIADELIRSGTFKRGILGFNTTELTPMMAQEKSMGAAIRGAAVTHLVPGSPAEKAGVKPGDVVIAINGRPVRGNVDYVARVATTPIGRTLKIEVFSKGTTRKLDLTVVDIKCEPTPETPPMSLRSLDGLTLGVMLPGFDAFGKVQGARVIGVSDTLSARTGLQADDVITGVEGTTTRTPQDVYDLATSKMGRYRLDVSRGGRPHWIWVNG